jgi:ParB-like chromosome segregation protein Spo0J
MSEEFVAVDRWLAGVLADLDALADLSPDARIHVINRLREKIHQHSPFANEPVDCVLWIKAEGVHGNEYNPNSVAPPEMKLLEHSITEDGYTQPIVAWRRDDDSCEVVDGFHRHRVGKESPVVRERVRGYLPLVIVNHARLDKGDRIASTIRHNRARGKHRIDAMAEIVLDLKRRNWSDTKIGKELGMDADEVLRLAQITGLAEMFADRNFSEAWEASALDEADTVGVNLEDDGGDFV